MSFPRRNTPLIVYFLGFIFAGALLGFVLARVQYLSIDGKFKNGSSPGEWYWLRSGYRKVGITLHLATILPAGFLVVFQVSCCIEFILPISKDSNCLPPQFIPIIRYKALMFHRINGYVIIPLLLLSHPGAIMVARYSFGGEIETQVMVGLLVIMTTVGISLAYYNIKRLQIDQHRAWMLRTWFYACSIITLRIIMILSSLIATKTGGYYRAKSCDEIKFILDDQSQFESSYPQCFAVNGTIDGWIALPASFDKDGARISNSLGMCFGTAGWLALAIHAIGVEIYLQLTPRENERLRTVSYQRQLEAGFNHPGSAGITSDRWGDADAWQPPNEKPLQSDGEGHGVKEGRASTESP